MFPTGVLSAEQKRAHMASLAEWREKKYKEPELRQLFLELTLRCNERCLHCGSSCGEVSSPELSAEEIHTLLDKVRRDFDIRKMQLAVTGGEPLLRRDFFEILGDAREMGYRWGMTSNGTLITKEIAGKLREAGMETISVSIDGLRESHDAFRQTPGGYDRAMRGLENLLAEEAFSNVQVTTVVHHGTIGELDALYEIFEKTDIDSWRVIGIEPMGRAHRHPELLLTPDDWRRLFRFIREKRSEGLPVLYGCSHYLGTDFEREVRDWYFLCNAGIYVASVMANGDIGSCLDIERRPETVFGNIRDDDFTEVWRNRFGTLRKAPGEHTARCRDCAEYSRCAGDSWHSFDFDRQEPRICFRDILF